MRPCALRRARSLRCALGIVALGIAQGSAAWAAKPEPPPVPDHVRAARDRVDWEAAGAEAAEILAGYLRIDTSNPPGDEERGADYLARVLEGEGIGWEMVFFEPGRASLIARVEGSGEAPPLCLLSHIDVATAEPERWTEGKGPFSGVVDEEGVIWGRGALDMKGMGAIELLTLAWLERLDVPLRRDVVLLAVADEEEGNGGMSQVVSRHWDLVGCSHLINEGGIGLRDVFFEGQAVHAISTAEKGLAWIRMTATGRAGHGSTPMPGEAPDRLLAAMTAIERHREPHRIDPVMYELLDAVGRHRGGLTGLVLRSRPLVNLLVRPKLLSNPATRATITDTVHLTGVSGAKEPNVIPSEVSAVYDCRLLPGTTPEEAVERLRRWVRKVDGIAFELLHAAEANGSPREDPLYEALARYTVEDRPYAVAAPLLSVGYTDSLLARPLGVRAYGLEPFEVEPEVAATMHGHDERLPAAELARGLRVLFSTVVEFAGDPDAGR